MLANDGSFVCTSVFLACIYVKMVFKFECSKFLKDDSHLFIFHLDVIIPILADFLWLSLKPFNF